VTLHASRVDAADRLSTNAALADEADTIVENEMCATLLAMWLICCGIAAKS
jgi:hypothetical protein